MIPAPGERLCGRFVVDGPPLGEGRTGVVVPAIDEDTGSAVAIKLLHPHLAADAATLARMQADAGVAAHLAHPHIVRVRGVWSDGGRWLLVSERVDGRPLEDMLVTPLQPAAAIALGLELADALATAHAHGVVHGDVRPGNVLVGPRGVLLFDFGLPALPDDAERVRPGETAPEVRRGAPPGVPADLYGLGVVLYRALAARPPFEAPTPWGVIGRQERERPAPPAPAGLAALVSALLDPDPARRPPSAAAVRDALARLARDPSRRPRFGRRLVAPIAIGATHVVHGVDPATGGPAVVQAGLSRRRAVDLVRRLRREGWTVNATREALGGGDLVVVLLAALAGGWLVPVLGAPLFAVLALWQLSATCRPEIRDALPAARAPVPPRRLASGTEYYVTAGLLLLIAAALVWWWPAAAIAPLVLLAPVVWGLWRLEPVDRARVAADARARLAFDEVRRRIAGAGRPIDEALALEGELHALEQAWRRGDGGDEVVTRAEALMVRAGALPASDADGARRAIEALRRAQAEVTPPRPPST